MSWKDKYELLLETIEKDFKEAKENDKHEEYMNLGILLNFGNDLKEL